MSRDLSSADLHYCPRCRGELIWLDVESSGVLHPACSECGGVLWQNRKPSVEAVILRGESSQSEILLGRRMVDGLWDLPGGFLNATDSLEGVLLRECKREMGIEVTVGDILGAFEDAFAGIPLVSIAFVCKLKAGEPTPAPPIDAVQWFPLFNPPPVAFAAAERAVLRAQNEMNLRA